MRLPDLDGVLSDISEKDLARYFVGFVLGKGDDGVIFIAVNGNVYDDVCGISPYFAYCLVNIIGANSTVTFAVNGLDISNARATGYCNTSD